MKEDLENIDGVAKPRLRGGRRDYGTKMLFELKKIASYLRSISIAVHALASAQSLQPKGCQSSTGCAQTQVQQIAPKGGAVAVSGLEEIADQLTSDQLRENLRNALNEVARQPAPRG